MTLVELRGAISTFRDNVTSYRDLMRQSRDPVMSVIVRHGAEITRTRSALNTEFGALAKYITKLGNNPRISDGVNPQTYSPYNNAFSNDILLRVGRSTDAVLQDLDYITGRLDAITENEFSEITRPQKQKNYWHITSPFWLAWMFLKWLWHYKFFSGPVVVLGLLAIDFHLAWQNWLWIRNHILGLFSF